MQIESKLSGNHFDKVLLVAEIARLETLLDHERRSSAALAQANQDMAKALKAHAGRTAQAMNFSLEKIPPLVQALRAWIPENNRESFDEVAALPAFQQALGLGIKALFVEVLGAGPAQ